MTLYIGTSGWSYKHWEGPLYPPGLPQNERLAFFSKHFSTVEINNSFYCLPKKETFVKWRTTVARDFIFAVKASRFITHVKKLNDVEEPVKKFLENAKELESKLGPILFQFPPRWKLNLTRLSQLFEILPPILEYTFEFRHPSWFCEDIYQLLIKNKAALCLADSPHWPCKLKITTDFTFIRMHGGKMLYGSNYSSQELKSWARKIKNYTEKGIKTYVYFNNDAYGYAIKNANQLIKIMEEI